MNFPSPQKPDKVSVISNPLIGEMMIHDPIPVISARNGQIIDANPRFISATRRCMRSLFDRLIGAASVVDVPQLTGAIAAGVLVQTFPHVTDSLGVEMNVSAADTLPSGVYTASLTYFDSRGTLKTQTCNFEHLDKTKSMNLVWFFCSNAGDIVMPQISPVSAVQPVTVSFTGPNGIQISTTLVTSKNPRVLEFTRTLYETVIEVLEAAEVEQVIKNRSYQAAPPKR